MKEKIDISPEIMKLPFVEELIEVRSNISSSDGVGVYSIFNNEQLVDLSKKRPKTIEELSKLAGFPAKGSRISRWGSQIVGVFNGKTVGNTKSKSFS